MNRPSLQSIPRYATGAAATIAAAYHLVTYGGEVAIAVASLFFAVVCITDTLWSRIPNLATFPLFAAGTAIGYGTAGWTGLLLALGGAVAGFGLLLLPYLMGGMGAGDVKALAALGALTGPFDIAQIFLYTALAGGLLGVIHYLFATNLKEKCRQWSAAFRAALVTGELGCFRSVRPSKQLRFPYASAIAFGYFAFVNWGGVL